VLRKRAPLRGEAEIGLAVGAVLDKHKMGKHFEIAITDTSLVHRRTDNTIAAEARLDGIYVIRTNVPQEALSPEETVGAYKALAQVERAFRSTKTVDLEIRPVFHWTAPRVRAHVFLCMLAYYVEHHMRRRLAPILFDDHDRAAAAAERQSIVAPAKRSPAALRKATSRRTTTECRCTASAASSPTSPPSPSTRSACPATESTASTSRPRRQPSRPAPSSCSALVPGCSQYETTPNRTLQSPNNGLPTSAMKTSG